MLTTLQQAGVAMSGSAGKGPVNVQLGSAPHGTFTGGFVSAAKARGPPCTIYTGELPSTELP